MKIDDYIDGMNPSTAIAYRSTAKYLAGWLECKNTMPHLTFDKYLANLKLAENTRIKHIRQARTIVKNCNLNYEIDAKTPVKTIPPQFSNDDFQTLYAAFDDCPFPTFIQSDQRYRFWQTIIHFVAVTALRRQAILGVNQSDVNWHEHTIYILPENDKKQKFRTKPLTADLVANLLDLLRFYDKDAIPASMQNRLFPWTHCTNTWYKCWNTAEERVGMRFRLLDLKRFSGHLALQAGANAIELMKHMDHQG